MIVSMIVLHCIEQLIQKENILFIEILSLQMHRILFTTYHKTCDFIIEQHFCRKVIQTLYQLCREK